MIARGSLWLPLAILALLAGLSFWIERAVQPADGSGGGNKADPEGIMENFEALRTDSQGNPQYRLTASRLKHYTGSKRTEMEAPRFVLMDADGGDITAVSKHATVSEDGDEIELTGSVDVTRAARPGQSAMTLSTERLLVYPERNLLRAPGRVNLRDANLALQAGAMEYRADTRRVKLSGGVRARYLSPAP